MFILSTKSVIYAINLNDLLAAGRNLPEAGKVLLICMSNRNDMLFYMLVIQIIYVTNNS